MMKSKYTDMTLEEKRKLYVCGENYVCLPAISSWPILYKKVKAPTSSKSKARSKKAKQVGSEKLRRCASLPSLIEPEEEIQRKESLDENPLCMKTIAETSSKKDDLVNDEINSKVSIWHGDILKLEIDAIVNAPSTSLRDRGGENGILHKLAGPTLMKECIALNGCEVGEAKITSGHKLPAKYIVHTIGPLGKNLSSLLQNCYESCLELVLQHNIKTIAFCCISTGLYGYPHREAAEIALKTARKWLLQHSSKVDRIIFCTSLARDFQIYQRLMTNKYFKCESQTEVLPEVTTLEENKNGESLEPDDDEAEEIERKPRSKDDSTIVRRKKAACSLRRFDSARRSTVSSHNKRVNVSNEAENPVERRKSRNEADYHPLERRKSRNEADYHPLERRRSRNEADNPSDRRRSRSRLNQHSLSSKYARSDTSSGSSTPEPEVLINRFGFQPLGSVIRKISNSNVENVYTNEASQSDLRIWKPGKYENSSHLPAEIKDTSSDAYIRSETTVDRSINGIESNYPPDNESIKPAEIDDPRTTNINSMQYLTEPSYMPSSRRYETNHLSLADEIENSYREDDKHSVKNRNNESYERFPENSHYTNNSEDQESNEIFNDSIDSEDSRAKYIEEINETASTGMYTLPESITSNNEEIFESSNNSSHLTEQDEERFNNPIENNFAYTSKGTETKSFDSDNDVVNSRESLNLCNDNVVSKPSDSDYSTDDGGNGTGEKQSPEYTNASSATINIDDHMPNGLETINSIDDNKPVDNDDSVNTGDNSNVKSTESYLSSSYKSKFLDTADSDNHTNDVELFNSLENIDCIKTIEDDYIAHNGTSTDEDTIEKSDISSTYGSKVRSDTTDSDYHTYESESIDSSDDNDGIKFVENNDSTSNGVTTHENSIEEGYLSSSSSSKGVELNKCVDQISNTTESINSSDETIIGVIPIEKPIERSYLSSRYTSTSFESDTASSENQKSNGSDPINSSSDIKANSSNDNTLTRNADSHKEYPIERSYLSSSYTSKRFESDTYKSNNYKYSTTNSVSRNDKPDYLSSSSYTSRRFETDSKTNQSDDKKNDSYSSRNKKYSVDMTIKGLGSYGSKVESSSYLSEHRPYSSGVSSSISSDYKLRSSYTSTDYRSKYSSSIGKSYGDTYRKTDYKSDYKSNISSSYSTRTSVTDRYSSLSSYKYKKY